jgi:hypothetical protein
MGADTKWKHGMGKRFALVIGVAAVGVTALGAQTATSTTGRVDRVPPDLQLLGPKKQDPVIAPGTDCGGPQAPLACGACDHGACVVKVNFRCDERCTARATGRLTNVENAKLKPAGGSSSPHRGKPGGTGSLWMFVSKETRINAGAALAEGKNVEARVTVRARDAAGNVATAKETITLVTHVE